MIQTFRGKSSRLVIRTQLMILILIAITHSLSQAQIFGAGGNVNAKLISEVTSVQPGSDFWVAIQMKMDKGWHTY